MVKQGIKKRLAFAINAVHYYCAKDGTFLSKNYKKLPIRYKKQSDLPFQGKAVFKFLKAQCRFLPP